MANEEYIEEFIADAKEQIENLNNSILVLEKNQSDKEAIDVIFRAAHTLKGNSATMGFMSIKEMMHKLENVFDEVRNNKVKVNSDLIDLVFECIDEVEAMVDDVASSGSEGDTSGNAAIIERLKQMLTSSEVEKKDSDGEQGAGNKGGDVEFNLDDNARKKIAGAKDKVLRAKIVLTEDCMFPGVRVQLVFNALENVCEVVGSHPDLKLLEEGNFGKEFNLLIISEEEQGKIKKRIMGVAEIRGVSIEKYSDRKAAEKQEISKDAVPVGGESKKNVVQTVQNIRVSITKLDSLMNLAGELVIAKIGLDELSKRYHISELDRIISDIDKMIIKLQDEVIEARMVPVKHIFDKFPRMVRDLAKKQSKEVNFIVEGEEITLDRTVLDKIGDPLVHLLRNAVDHGVEVPEERKKNNKKPTGVVKLVAKKEKNTCVIEVSDDGNGMNPEVLKMTAIKKGLITEKEAGMMTEKEAFNLIFLPGFSTTEVITDVSGRGVGMDVVQSTIRSLRGTYTINSEKDIGTTVTLRLPLSLAIIQSLFFRAGTREYAVPMDVVNNIITIKKSDIKKIQNEDTIIYRNSNLPLFWLKKLLCIEENQGDEEKDIHFVLVVERKGEEIGLIIDEVIGEQHIIIKPLENILKQTNGFSGATILGSGRVILIVDVGTLFE